jgi:hypothetical protein
MVLILGLVTPEMQVHGGKKAQIIGGTVGGAALLGLIGGGVVIYKKRAAAAAEQQALADAAKKQALADAAKKQDLADDDMEFDPKLDSRPLKSTRKEPEDHYTAKEARRKLEAEMRAQNGRPEVRKIQMKQGIKRPDINDYQEGPQYEAPDGSTFTVKKHDGNSYTKTFSDGRLEMYDKNGLLELKTFTDGRINSYQYGFLLSTQEGNINRLYIRKKVTYLGKEEIRITGYEDYFNNGNFAGKGENGKHYGKDGKTHEKDRSGIKLAQQDRSLTSHSDPGGKMVANEKNTASETEDAATDNKSAAENSQNQNEVVAGNNPGGGSNQRDGGQSNEGGDGEGGAGKGGYGEDVV